MKDTKTEIKFFSVPQWKKEEEYLREQHKNGWEFVALSGLCLYRFRRCEPKDVVYQLDYNPDSLVKKMNTFKCLGIADGNTCRIMRGTVIFGKQLLKWTEQRKKFSVTMLPGWI